MAEEEGNLVHEELAGVSAETPSIELRNDQRDLFDALRDVMRFAKPRIVDLQGHVDGQRLELRISVAQCDGAALTLQQDLPLPPIPDSANCAGEISYSVAGARVFTSRGRLSLHSVRPVIGRRSEECLSLHRGPADAPFTPHDLTALATLHGSMALKRISSDTCPCHKLPWRARQVLDGLLKGLSEKQMADQLEISIHTVHVYVKDIYRQFKVHSHVELMGLWMRGQGHFCTPAAQAQQHQREAEALSHPCTQSIDVPKNTQSENVGKDLVLRGKAAGQIQSLGANAHTPDRRNASQ